VLVFEEVEKGHPAFLDVLLEVLDGSFKTGRGEEVATDGLSVLIGSNQGCDRPATALGFTARDDDERRAAAVQAAVGRLLDPRLASRLEQEDAIFYLPPLDDASLRNIVRLQAARLGRRRGVVVRITDEAVRHVVAQAAGDVALLGARAVLGVYRTAIEVPLRRLLVRERPAGVLVLFRDGGVVLAPVDELPVEAGGGEEGD